ncbi:hypothetical protein D3C76_858760 [compost metagenome]
MGSGDQVLGDGAIQARQIDVQLHFQTEAAGDLADADLAGDRGVGGNLHLLLAGNELDGADEAGRVARGEQLFGVGGFAARAAQFLRGGQFHVEDAVRGNGAAVAASGCSGSSGVEGLDALHEDVS